MLTMFAEVFENGQWWKVGKHFISTYEEMEGRLTDRVFDGHNKELESFLIARSHVFDTYERDDVSEDVKNHEKFKNACFMITLEELLELGWDDEKYKIGYISEWQYERLKRDGIKPVIILNEPHSGSTVISPFLMDLIIANPCLRKVRRYLVKYQYDKHSMKELFDFFCYESIPGLIKLIPEGGTASDVRIVFSI